MHKHVHLQRRSRQHLYTIGLLKLMRRRNHKPIHILRLLSTNKTHHATTTARQPIQCDAVLTNRLDC
jgi:hypothetical protein